jgi:hypothetical protein
MARLNSAGAVCDLTTQGAPLLDQVSPEVADAQRLLVGMTERDQAQLLRRCQK